MKLIKKTLLLAILATTAGCSTELPGEVNEIRTFLEKYYERDMVRIREYTPLDSIYSSIPIYQEISDKMLNLKSYTESDKRMMEELYNRYLNVRDGADGNKNAIGIKVVFKLYDKLGDRHVETFIFSQDHKITAWGLTKETLELIIPGRYKEYMKEYDKKNSRK